MLPKLVRDRVPDSIRDSGAVPKVRFVAGPELLVWLFRKLREESAELESNPSAEELSDILEVLHAIAASLSITWEQVESMGKDKEARLGSFQEGIILEDIIRCS